MDEISLQRKLQIDSFVPVHYSFLLIFSRFSLHWFVNPFSITVLMTNWEWKTACFRAFSTSPKLQTIFSLALGTCPHTYPRLDLILLKLGLGAFYTGHFLFRLLKDEQGNQNHVSEAELEFCHLPRLLLTETVLKPSTFWSNFAALPMVD